MRRMGLRVCRGALAQGRVGKRWWAVEGAPHDSGAAMVGMEEGIWCTRSRRGRAQVRQPGAAEGGYAAGSFNAGLVGRLLCCGRMGGKRGLGTGTWMGCRKQYYIREAEVESTKAAGGCGLVKEALLNGCPASVEIVAWGPLFTLKQGAPGMISVG